MQFATRQLRADGFFLSASQFPVLTEDSQEDHILEDTPLADPLTQDAFTTQSGFLQDSSRRGVSCHVVGVNSVELQYGESVTNHSSGGFGRKAPSPLVNRDPEPQFGQAVVGVNVSQSHRADQLAIGLRDEGKHPVFHGRCLAGVFLDPSPGLRFKKWVRNRNGRIRDRSFARQSGDHGRVC